MGTPDLQGTFGTFSFFTDDPFAATEEVAGGRIVRVNSHGTMPSCPSKAPPTRCAKTAPRRKSRSLSM